MNNTNPKKITAQEFSKIKNSSSPYVLDVRNPDEFENCHIPGSINLPLDFIEKGQTASIPRDQTIFLTCQSGMRTERARKILESIGYTELICIDGGLSECSKVQGLVSQKSKRLPLMRQVQIAAGSLVLIGIILSRFLHPSFIYLSIFVGSGLIFAGSTGFCGMALLLQKMPWNRISGGTCEN